MEHVLDSIRVTKPVICNHQDCSCRWLVVMNQWPRTGGSVVSIHTSIGDGWSVEIIKENGWFKLTFYCPKHGKENNAQDCVRTD